KFLAKGYPKVYALKGGWREWHAANFPMEKK
ncbi:MAG: rhodanese-like sulfurtransferase, partial [Desulfomonilaceae bacterium]